MTRLRDPRNFVIVALVGLLLWRALPAVDAPVRDGGGGDNARDLIAVTGTYGSGASALYLIDAKTRHMAVYRLENGQALELVAARNVTYDLFLETYGDGSAEALRPSRLRDRWRQHNEAAARTTPSVPETPTEGAPEAPPKSPSNPGERETPPGERGR